MFISRNIQLYLFSFRYHSACPPRNVCTQILELNAHCANKLPMNRSYSCSRCDFVQYMHVAVSNCVDF